MSHLGVYRWSVLIDKLVQRFNTIIPFFKVKLSFRTTLKRWTYHPATYLSPFKRCSLYGMKSSNLKIKVKDYSFEWQSTFKKQVCFHCSYWIFSVSKFERNSSFSSIATTNFDFLRNYNLFRYRKKD